MKFKESFFHLESEKYLGGSLAKFIDKNFYNFCFKSCLLLPKPYFSHESIRESLNIFKSVENLISNFRGNFASHVNWTRIEEKLPIDFLILK